MAEAFGLSGAPVLSRPGGGVEVFDVSEAQCPGTTAEEEGPMGGRGGALSQV